MKNKRISKLLAIALCLSMASATAVSSVIPASAANGAGETFAQKMNSRFKTPEMEYRPEARWWLAEGSHTDETLIESIHELYDSGFGAVEFVTLDESQYLNDARYAWASEEWVHDSHLIVEECTKLGMGVSFTGGTNWASANLTTITPDEEMASQELGYQTINLEAGERFSGSLPVPELPGSATKATFVRATVARTGSVTESGFTNLEVESMRDVTSLAVQQDDGSWSIDYTAPDDGVYTLFAFWQYGTSETYKPASTGVAYTINYLSKEGANALIEYWDEQVLDDSLKEMIAENGDVQFYMDSLELSPHGKNTTGNLWCADYLEEFEARRGYDLTPYLPVIILPGFAVHTERNYIYGMQDNEELCEKVLNDVYQTNTELYQEECLDVLTEWLHSFGMTLRAENAYGQMFEMSQSVKSVDYVETEAWEMRSEIDSFRNQSGAAHLYGKTFSSETGALLGANYTKDNSFWRQVFYTQFASGIQRTVVHGYSAAYGPEQNCKWPGYEGMQANFSDRFNRRQPNSIDYADLNAHLARTQKVLRQGVPQMDLGILRNDYYFNCLQCFQGFDYANNALREHRAFYWTDMSLQDAGYTYDYFSPYLLQDGEISCENGLVQADGVGYQALLVYQEEMPYESAQVLYQWAKNGLPVVIVDGPSTEKVRNAVYKDNAAAAITTGHNDGMDEELADVMAQIKELDNVATVASQADTYQALLDLGVRPRAEYVESDQQNLLSVLRRDEDASYLYVYNYMYQDAENYAGQISLDGIYKPYLLNTWTGEAEEIADFTYRDGRTILSVDLAPGDIMVFALDPNDKSDTTVVAKENIEKVTVENGQTLLYVPDSGRVEATLSDGSIFAADVNAPADILLNNWSLVVQDWQPGDKVTRTEDRGLGYTTSEVTYETNKVDINVGNTALIPWKDIEGVGENVSGVGSYTTTFTLPDNWSGEKNALTFWADSFSGATAAVFVNGQKVAVNMDSCTADLSEAVRAGENTLEVRVTSSLLNRMKQVGYSGWLGSPATADYGMVGAAGLTAYAKVAVTTSDTDKTILNKVLAYAEGQYADPSFDNVIETVQASFTAALENAREISANRAATQQQIDSAWQILMTEIHKLGFVRGDKTALGQLIETAEEFAQIIDRYTPATAQPFTTALEAAKETYSDGDAMQGEVTEAESSLLQAMLDLRYRADKSVLKQVLADAASRDLTAYTTESVTAFHAASDAAKTVYDNSDATQQEVDDAASALTEAIGNLERTELSTQQPAVQGDKEATTQSGNAKTGEAIPIAAVIVLTLAGAGFFLSKKKR